MTLIRKVDELEELDLKVNNFIPLLGLSRGFSSVVSSCMYTVLN